MRFTHEFSELQCNVENTCVQGLCEHGSKIETDFFERKHNATSHSHATNFKLILTNGGNQKLLSLNITVDVVT